MGGLVPPLSVVETWPKPNYLDPVRKGNALMIIPIVLCAILTVIVLARLWSRIIILKNPGWDDVLITFAFLPAVGLTVTYCLAYMMYYFDRHIWDVPISAFEPAAKLGWVIEFLYHICISVTKISVLLFYKRVVAGTKSDVFLNIVRFTLAFQIVWLVVFSIVLLLACRPLNAYWLRVSLTPYTNPHVCLSEGVYWLVAAAVSWVTDVIATVLPSWLVYHLKLPKRQKIALYCIFSLGFLTCAFDILRIVYLYRLFDANYDAFWEGYSLFIWTAVETDCAMICASAPALRPYFSRYFADLPERPSQQPPTSPGFRSGNFSPGTLSRWNSRNIPRSYIKKEVTLTMSSERESMQYQSSAGSMICQPYQGPSGLQECAALDIAALPPTHPDWRPPREWECPLSTA